MTRPLQGAEARQEAVRALQGTRWTLTPLGRAARAADTPRSGARYAITPAGRAALVEGAVSTVPTDAPRASATYRAPTP